jgi:hypothetical protein
MGRRNPVALLFLVAVVGSAGGVSAQLPGLLPTPRHIEWSYGVERHIDLAHFDRLVLADACLSATANAINTALVEVGRPALPIITDAEALAAVSGDIWVGLETDLSALTVVNGLPAPQREGFRLFVSEDWVVVVGENPAGAAHGLDCLRQCITGGAGTLPAVALSDWPGVEFRAVYVDDLPSEVDVDAWAQLRVNAVICRDERFFLLDDPSVAANVSAAFDACRARFIEPIPLIDLLTHADALLAQEPSLAEGVLIEHIFEVSEGALTATEPWYAPLSPLTNVLGTDSAPLSLSAFWGDIVYIPGIDYTYPAAPTYPFAEDHLELRALPGGRLAEGAQVRVTYTAALPGTRDVCPSEPLWQAAATAAIGQVVSLLHPRYLHIGLETPQIFASDLRCRQRNLPNAALLAGAVSTLHAAAKAADPDVRIMIWADAIDPEQDAAIHDFQDAAETLPSDMFICPRYTVAEGATADAAIDALARFAQSGRKVAVAGMGDGDLASWVDALAQEFGTSGLIYVGPQQASALSVFTAAAWQAEVPVIPPPTDPPPTPPSQQELPIGDAACMGLAVACAVLALRNLGESR